MDIPVIWWLISLLSVWSGIAFVIILRLVKLMGRLRTQKRGAEVRRGFLVEQWLPLAESYPWNPKNFRFLGEPIDGIQFEDNEIVLLEFKSGASRLSSKQSRIRELITEGKISFKEVRVKVNSEQLDGIEIR